MNDFHVWPTKHLTSQPVSTLLSIIFGRQIGLALVVRGAHVDKLMLCLLKLHITKDLRFLFKSEKK